jgi:hypothetical protein
MAMIVQAGPEVLIQRGAFRLNPCRRRTPLKDGELAPEERAREHVPYDHPWGSLAQNGRLAGTLPRGPWKLMEN